MTKTEARKAIHRHSSHPLLPTRTVSNREEFASLFNHKITDKKYPDCWRRRRNSIKWRFFNHRGFVTGILCRYNIQKGSSRESTMR